MMPVATAGSLPIMAGGFKIILKDAKIYANKVIITTVKDEKTEQTVISTPHHDTDKKKDAEGLQLSDDLLGSPRKIPENRAGRLPNGRQRTRNHLRSRRSRANNAQTKASQQQWQAENPLSMLQVPFLPPIETYPNKITEVKLGGNKKRRRHTRTDHSQSAEKFLLLSTLLSDQCHTNQSSP